MVHKFRPIPNFGSLVTQNPKPGGKNCSFVNWIHFRKLLNPLNGTRFFSIPKPITTLKCVNGNYKSETDNISREKAVKYRSILPYSIKITYISQDIKMNSTLVFLFLMMVCSSTASLFTNKTIMFLTSTATNETIAKVKELGKYCEYPGNLKSRPRLYEPGWWCVVGVTCIPMSNICNGIYDCKDYHKSDERKACNLYPDTGK